MTGKLTDNLPRLRPPTESVTDLCLILLALVLAVTVGVLAASGHAIPETLTTGLGLSIGYFFGGHRRELGD